MESLKVRLVVNAVQREVYSIAFNVHLQINADHLVSQRDYFRRLSWLIFVVHIGHLSPGQVTLRII